MFPSRKSFYNLTAAYIGSYTKGETHKSRAASEGEKEEEEESSPGPRAIEKLYVSACHVV